MYNSMLHCPKMKLQVPDLHAALHCELGLKTAEMKEQHKQLGQQPTAGRSKHEQLERALRA